MAERAALVDRVAPMVIIGPTASGKSALAMRVAARLAAPRPGSALSGSGAALPGSGLAGSGPTGSGSGLAGSEVEIVSMDSKQVYRGMDIGTAKPTLAEQRAVPHHLIDIVDARDDFDLSQFQAAALGAIEAIESRGNVPLLVGGTGLYVQAVVDNLELPGTFPEQRRSLEADPNTEALHARLAVLDPVAASRMEPTNRRRVVRALEVTVGSGRPFSSFGPGMDTYPPTRFTMVGLLVERDELDRRIEARYRAQLDAGLLEEIRVLLDRPGGMSRTAVAALGYKEFVAHLRGEASLDEALELAILRTRRFSRRQQRWFRRDPRIEWIDVTATPEVSELAASLAARLRRG